MFHNSKSKGFKSGLLDVLSSAQIKMQECCLWVILDNVLICKPMLNLVEKSSIALLEQSIIQRLHYRLKDGFFVNFSGCSHSWHAEMTSSNPIPQYSPLHNYKKWAVISLISGKFYLGLLQCLNTRLVILLIEFLFCGKNFLIQIFTAKTQQLFWSFEL